jgi:signal transduction histidine kinase
MMVGANQRLLKMALGNLMLNAIQYSSDNQGNIVFNSWADRLEIKISNNGAVILDDERQFLFQYFFRGVNSKGKRGFGLGLVLIHKILQLHRGEISYYSSTDHSNTFVVSLPLN